MNRYFGLDGEMTTADINTGGRLIQIGVAADTDINGNVLEGSENFCALINPGEFDWDERAEAVHGFTREQILAAPPAEEVDLALEAWLFENGASDEYRGNIVPVGFNVGTFDMPHVKLVLPRSFARMSRRTADLNALAFGLEGRSYLNDPQPYDKGAWKSIAVAYAERTIAKLFEGKDAKAAHDAGYDALLHLHVWRFFRAAIHGKDLPVPQNVVPVPESKIMTIALMQAYGAQGASARTGVPVPFIKGWAQNGRALNLVYLESIRTAYNELIG